MPPNPLDSHANPLPFPLRLHWALILVLSLFTWGVFLPVWLFVQATWTRKVNGTSKAFLWAIANLCALPILFLVVVVLAFMADSPDTGEGPMRVGSALAFAILLTLYFTTLAKLRAELRQPPFALTLPTAQTCLGGPIYLQAKIQQATHPPSHPTATLGLTRA